MHKLNSNLCTYYFGSDMNYIYIFEANRNYIYI